MPNIAEPIAWAEHTAPNSGAWTRSSWIAIFPVAWNLLTKPREQLVGYTSDNNLIKRRNIWGEGKRVTWERLLRRSPLTILSYREFFIFKFFIILWRLLLGRFYTVAWRQDHLARTPPLQSGGGKISNSSKWQISILIQYCFWFSVCWPPPTTSPYRSSTKCLCIPCGKCWNITGPLIA